MKNLTLLPIVALSAVAVAAPKPTNKIVVLHPSAVATSQRILHDQETRKNSPVRSSQSRAPLNNSFASRFKFNGFMSAGIASSSAVAQYNIPGHGTVANTANFSVPSLVGLQMTARLNRNFDVVTQVVANGDNTNGHNNSGNTPFIPEVDWVFIKFHTGQNFSARAGRFRLPAFMFSDTQEVGYTYPWMFLPNEVYRILPFDNMNGVDALMSKRFGDGWTAQLNPFFGSNSSQYTIQPGTDIKFNENNILGGDVSVSNNIVTVRGAYAHTSVSAAGSTSSQSVALNNGSTSFYDAGVKVNYKGWFLAGEFAHRSTPNQLASLSGYYGTVGYRYQKFLPSFTYANLTTTNKNSLTGGLKSHLSQAQRSYTLNLAYYVSPVVVVKAMGSLIQPTDGTNGLFFEKPAKSDVYLYGLGVDAIF